MSRVILAVLLLSVPAWAEGETSIQGRLLVEEGRPPRLIYGNVTTTLSSDDPSILETFHDGRISGKNMKVVGRFLADGSFEAGRFFVVRPGGELVRLVYFCETCNITSFSPGDCACCQAPTVPTEIPLTDPRVHQDNIEVPARP